jgi:Fe-S cluster assembly protein SufD
MNVVLAKTETGRAVESIFTVSRDRLPGTDKVAEIRRQAFGPLSGPGCRIGASRNGNTRTCAA